jgi:hypothetical protein
MLRLSKVKPNLKSKKRTGVTAEQTETLGKHFAPAFGINGFKPGVKGTKTPSFEFQTPTNNEKDVLRKRQLMKHASQRVYAQMAVAVKAHETGRATLLYLNQLLETVRHPDERAIQERIAKKLSDVVEELLFIRQDKIEQAREMEVELERARRDNRTTLGKAAKTQESNDLAGGRWKEGDTSYMDDPAHPDTAAPEIAIDPKLLIHNAEKEIAGKEAALKAAKKAQKKEVTEEEEE